MLRERVIRAVLLAATIGMLTLGIYLRGQELTSAQTDRAIEARTELICALQRRPLLAAAPGGYVHARADRLDKLRAQIRSAGVDLMDAWRSARDPDARCSLAYLLILADSEAYLDAAGDGEALPAEALVWVHCHKGRLGSPATQAAVMELIRTSGAPMARWYRAGLARAEGDRTRFVALSVGLLEGVHTYGIQAAGALLSEGEYRDQAEAYLRGIAAGEGKILPQEAMDVLVRHHGGGNWPEYVDYLAEPTPQRAEPLLDRLEGPPAS